MKSRNRLDPPGIVLLLLLCINKTTFTLLMVSRKYIGIKALFQRNKYNESF